MVLNTRIRMCYTIPTYWRKVRLHHMVIKILYMQLIFYLAIIYTIYKYFYVYVLIYVLMFLNRVKVFIQNVSKKWRLIYAAKCLHFLRLLLDIVIYIFDCKRYITNPLTSASYHYIQTQILQMVNHTLNCFRHEILTNISYNM
jgi:hypothetical protein